MSGSERVVVRLDPHISSRPLVYSCISPKVVSLPDVLPPRERFSSEGLPDPTVARHLNWTHNAFPALPLTQRHGLFRGFLFQRLAVTEQSIPAVRVGQGWELENNFRTTWRNLEDGLRATVTSLWFAHKYEGKGRTSQSWLGESGRLFHRPTSYGYTQAWPSREELVAHTLQSRDAFLPLMAMCTLAIITLTPPGQALVPSDCAPAWRTALHRGHQGFSEQYVDLVARSPVADLEEFERAGVILDAHSCTFIDAVLAMAARGVLVWVCWGPFSNPYKGDQLKGHLPSLRSVKDALSAFEEAQKRKPADAAIDQSHTVVAFKPPRPTFPPPAPNSRQLRGETWQRFFARREKRNKARELEESDSERQSRLNREKAQSTHPCPGRRGPAVFEWQDVDGFLIRTYVNRIQIADVWGDYNDYTRKYNAFDNEWDLCTAFAKTKEQLRPDDDDDGEDEDGPPKLAAAGEAIATQMPLAICHTSTTSLLIPPLETVDLQVPNSGYQDELNAFFGLGAASEPFVVDDQNSLEAMLQYRYGMVKLTSYKRSTIQGLPTRSMTILKACMVLLDTDMPANLNHDAVVDFVRCMDSRGQHVRESRMRIQPDGGSRPFEIPFQLYDLDERNPNYLSRHRSFSVSVVTMTSAHGFKFYKLLPTMADPTEPWHIVVSSSITAVEVLRRGWRTQRDVVGAFVERGTAFYTGIPYVNDVNCPPLRKPQVSWRSSDFTASPSDYSEYEAVRDALLKEPRGRSALMVGGIVWRLAREILDVDAVLSGPSSQVVHGIRHEFPREGLVIYDDSFSRLEFDVICGVYSIYTGFGEQVTLKSWWPRQETWAQSGMDVGYWAPFCEKWFQKRLQGIRDGTACPRTSNEWRQALAFNKATNRVLDSIDEASARFLSSNHL